METIEDLLARLDQLNAIGASLSNERNLDRLLENILIAAKQITRAEGGTLYRTSVDQQRLEFAIVRNAALGFAMGGTSGNPVTLPPLPLHREDGSPNLSMVAAYAALQNTTVNIPDAYIAEGFDFSGTKAFDQRTGYRSKSFLTVPMCDHAGEVIGVLQLINARHETTGEVVAFSRADQHLAESLASQAAVALTNRLLVIQLEELFESFIGLINLAIDEKSPYTGGHCQRVPQLTMMLAEAVNATTAGPLADFTMSDIDRYELRIAGLLHDCGKVTTPVHVVDKAKKLETIFDRMTVVEARLEILRRDQEIKWLQDRLKARGASLMDLAAATDGSYMQLINQLKSTREFLRLCNTGGERMPDADIERVHGLAEQTWIDLDGKKQPFLTPDEVENLTIRAGTLTSGEREVINHHIIATIKMLEALPWPPHLKNVPEYAGGHHERMDGKGYPRGLTRDQMSVQARVMGIADIFEALTARDRPYKKAKTLSESLHIMGKFCLNGHIDPDLFDVFVRKKVYLQYAERFLEPEQIDEVDETKIPGYTP